MALTGIHVTCSFVGRYGSGGRADLYRTPRWSETLASAGTTTNTVVAGSIEKGEPVLGIVASVDVFVAIGAAPNAATGPRKFVKAGEQLDLYAEPGDRVAWIAA